RGVEGRQPRLLDDAGVERRPRRGHGVPAEQLAERHALPSLSQPLAKKAAAPSSSTPRLVGSIVAPMSRAQPPHRRFRRPLLAALAAAGLAATGLAACAPQVDTRGNLPDPET